MWVTEVPQPWACASSVIVAIALVHLGVLGDLEMKVWGREALPSWGPGEGEKVFRRGCEDHKMTFAVPLLSLTLCSLLQLDSEDAEPNFDEDGQDEYNELHMPV